MIEGSGSGSVPLTYGSGRPKSIRIRLATMLLCLKHISTRLPASARYLPYTTRQTKQITKLFLVPVFRIRIIYPVSDPPRVPLFSFCDQCCGSVSGMGECSLKKKITSRAGIFSWSWEAFVVICKEICTRTLLGSF